MAFGLTEKLRDAGIDIDLPIGGSMSKKLKKADKAVSGLSDNGQ